jgi:FkbH-like protein
MKKIALLSNININFLKFKFRKNYFTFFADGYNTWQQEILNKESKFYQFKPNFCFFIFDGEQFFELSKIKIINEVFKCIENIAEHLPLCRFYISNLDITTMHIYNARKNDDAILFEFEWQKLLFSAMKKYKNVYSFPLKDIVSQHGRNIIYSRKMWYTASSRFSVAGERIIAEKIHQLIQPAFIQPKKCLVLDLDNTLWGGVIAEDGIAGISLDDHGEGSRFYDFQKILFEIHERGVLLAILSKNIPEDVEQVFSHKKMILQKNIFSSIKLGWDAKSDNIVKISRELNIGLDSLVFVDDNPIEREAMRQHQPDVVVVDFPADTTQLYQLGIDLYDNYFYTWNTTEEDTNKAKMYEENTKRLCEIKKFSSLEDFLVNMDMELIISRVNSDLLLRTYQMIQKTNQFNVTTKRYTEEELSIMLEDKQTLMLIGRIEDKYGDNGNSILIIARMISSHEAEIDSFLMSCRIMNRTIEFGFLYEAEKKLKEIGADIIYATYIKTPKNEPAGMFFEEAGYEVISSSIDKKYYRLVSDLNNGQKRKKCYATII